MRRSDRGQGLGQKPALRVSLSFFLSSSATLGRVRCPHDIEQLSNTRREIAAAMGRWTRIDGG